MLGEKMLLGGLTARDRTTRTPRRDRDRVPRSSSTSSRWASWPTQRLSVSRREACDNLSNTQPGSRPGVPASDDGRDLRVSLGLQLSLSVYLAAREESTEWLIEQTAVQLVEEYRCEYEAVTEEKAKRQKPVEEFVTESKIDAIIKAEKLYSKQELRDQLADDMKALRDKEWMKLRAVEVFRIIFESESISSTGVARRLGDELSYKGLVTRIARDFAGIDCSNRDTKTWENHPLVIGESDEWKLTAYGQALGYYLDEQDDSVLREKGIPDEILEAAVVEVGLVDS